MSWRHPLFSSNHHISIASRSHQISSHIVPQVGEHPSAYFTSQFVQRFQTETGSMRYPLNRRLKVGRLSKVEWAAHFRCFWEHFLCMMNIFNTERLSLDQNTAGCQAFVGSALKYMYPTIPAFAARIPHAPSTEGIMIMII